MESKKSSDVAKRKKHALGKLQDLTKKKGKARRDTGNLAKKQQTKKRGPKRHTEEEKIQGMKIFTDFKELVKKTNKLPSPRSVTCKQWKKIFIDIGVSQSNCTDGVMNDYFKRSTDKLKLPSKTLINAMRSALSFKGDELLKLCLHRPDTAQAKEPINIPIITVPKSTKQVSMQSFVTKRRVDVSLKFDNRVIHHLGIQYMKKRAKGDEREVEEILENEIRKAERNPILSAMLALPAGFDIRKLTERVLEAMCRYETEDDCERSATVVKETDIDDLCSSSEFETENESDGFGMDYSDSEIHDFIESKECERKSGKFDI